MKYIKSGQFIIIGVLAFTILFMSIGFAAYSQTLNIQGTTTVNAVKWSVHWKANSLAVQNDSVSLTNSSLSDTDVTFTATLEKPGDKVHFKVTAINDGDFNAKLSAITMTSLTSAQAKYLTYTIKYAGTTYSSSASSLNVSLPATSGSNEAEVEVTATYIQPENSSDLPASNVNITLSAYFDYDQVV